jgi:creatinine amidohydrolase
MQGAFIENLTWIEVRQRIDLAHLVIIPIGAAAKAHGHHLPMQTDYLNARELAQRLCRRAPVLVAPVVSFGYYPAFVPFAGSQSLSRDTFQTLLVELMEGLIGHGARKLMLLNTGVSTEQPVDDAAAQIHRRYGVQPVASHMRLLGKSAQSVIVIGAGGHADERETSLMLAIAPQLVHLERAVVAQDDHFARSGATGDPRQASAAKGEALLQAMVEDLLRELGRGP